MSSAHPLRLGCQWAVPPIMRAPLPSAAFWWKTTEKYRGGSCSLRVGRQILHEEYTLGKVLKTTHLLALASKTNFAIDSINVVLTAKDVAVDGFCMSRCGTHGSSRGPARGTYIWVGNSETQCPGQCAWPFHQPIYGPQTPPLVAPNGDVGVDGMIINLATLLANTVTNPFNSVTFKAHPLPLSRPYPLARVYLGRGLTRDIRVGYWWTRPRGQATTPTVSMDASTCYRLCGTRKQVHAKRLCDEDTWQ
ncbi:hypothetical protein GH714_007701 [Hevea brasiliensis]|uniref:Uncharacterized protein n=1 Tax=Hevea brasiliensis TaxID=3981 RepID=A0A6A6L018_HEVBR|nr:hypothetical protein GH714_007701 [Hevea brasiliensis]